MRLNMNDVEKLHRILIQNVPEMITAELYPPFLRSNEPALSNEQIEQIRTSIAANESYPLVVIGTGGLRTLELALQATYEKPTLQRNVQLVIIDQSTETIQTWHRVKDNIGRPEKTPNAISQIGMLEPLFERNCASHDFGIDYPDQDADLFLDGLYKLTRSTILGKMASKARVADKHKILQEIIHHCVLIHAPIETIHFKGVIEWMQQKAQILFYPSNIRDCMPEEKQQAFDEATAGMDIHAITVIATETQRRGYPEKMIVKTPCFEVAKMAIQVPQVPYANGRDSNPDHENEQPSHGLLFFDSNEKGEEEKMSTRNQDRDRACPSPCTIL